MNEPRQPRPDDAVLGGQSLAPLDGAVLGGLEGVKRRFELGDIEQKKQALDQALQYGDLGIEFLVAILEQELSTEIKGYAQRLRVLALLEKPGDKNLTGMDLSTANLSGIKLIQVNLSEADLYEANLSGANLSRANLSEAFLPYANLSLANLNEANLSGAYLTFAELSEVKLNGANLSGADLTFVTLNKSELINANLTNTNLSLFRQSRQKNSKIHPMNLPDTLIDLACQPC